MRRDLNQIQSYSVQVPGLWNERRLRRDRGRSEVSLLRLVDDREGSVSSPVPVNSVAHRRAKPVSLILNFVGPEIKDGQV